LRKILIAVVLIGAVASTAGAGTFASFNATTTNSSGTFQTGTIVLSNTKTGGTGTCFSYGASATSFSNGNANACDSLFTFSSNNKPSATVYSVNLTMQALGTINASAFKVYASTACASTNDGGSYHGNGDLCSFLKISIQEYDSGFSTPTSSCVFPVSAGASCAATPAGGLDTFSSTYTSSGALGLGTMNATTSKYYKVSLALPNNATGGFENAIMGKQASFALGWVLEQ
jgi:predicted ribosomally synthesized peptide with SipW-like signal peptide